MLSQTAKMNVTKKNNTHQRAKCAPCSGQCSWGTETDVPELGYRHSAAAPCGVYAQYVLRSKKAMLCSVASSLLVAIEVRPNLAVITYAHSKNQVLWIQIYEGLYQQSCRKCELP